MKYLVTGGAGYIGSHTVHQLIEAGHSVVVLDNLQTGHEWAIHKAAQFIRGNVGDPDLLDRIFSHHRFDGVLHFAANIEVAESVTNPAKYYENNTVASLRLFTAVARAKVPSVIFSSTAAVYGNPRPAFANEDAELSPLNPYGASKVMSERILSDLIKASSGVKYVILRYFNVAGARIDGRLGQATPRATHLIKVAAEAALGLRPAVSIFGTDYETASGTCERDFIHVEDLARAHLDALAYLDQGGASDVFNVGYGRTYSVREVIEMMKRVSGHDFPVIEESRRPGDAVTVAADNSKILATLGWRPQFENLELICKTALDWEKNYRARSYGQIDDSSRSRTAKERVSRHEYSLDVIQR